MSQFTNKENPSLQLEALRRKFCYTNAMKPYLEALPPGGKSCNTHWTLTVKLFLKTLPSDENSAIPSGQIQ